MVVFQTPPTQSLHLAPNPAPPLDGASGLPPRTSSNYYAQDLNRPYTYNYAVRDQAGSGNGFAFQEEVQSLDGASVSGTYQVRLPDGRLQKVTYTAGPKQAQYIYQDNKTLPYLLGKNRVLHNDWPKRPINSSAKKTTGPKARGI